MKLKTLLPLVAVPGLAACFDGPGPATPGSTACPAASLQYMIGQPASVAESYVYSPKRVKYPGEAYTLDYNPNRLNFTITGGAISAVSCN